MLDGLLTAVDAVVWLGSGFTAPFIRVPDDPMPLWMHWLHFALSTALLLLAIVGLVMLMTGATSH